MANHWLRLWHDMPNDPKWRTVARVSGQSIALVQAIYIHLLVDASRNVTRGHADVTIEDLSSALDVTERDIELVLEAMQGRVLDGTEITGWTKRQVKREELGPSESGAMTAAERKRKQREREKATTLSEDKNSMSRNVTDVSRNVTTDKEEKREDKRREKKEQKETASPRCAPEGIEEKGEPLSWKTNPEFFRLTVAYEEAVTICGCPSNKGFADAFKRWSKLSLAKRAFFQKGFVRYLKGKIASAERLSSMVVQLGVGPTAHSFALAEEESHEFDDVKIAELLRRASNPDLPIASNGSAYNWVNGTPECLRKSH